MNNRFNAVASVMLALSTVTAVIAQDARPPGGPPHAPVGTPQGGPGGPGGRGGPGGPGGRGGPDGPRGAEQAVLVRIINDPEAAKELGLTDEQVKTLSDGIFDISQQKIKLRAEMEVAAIQQARLLTADPVDEKALMEAVEKTGGIRTELAKVEMKALLLRQNTLSAEQRGKLNEMIRRDMQSEGRGGPPGGRDRRQRGPGRPGGGPAGPQGGPGSTNDAPPPGDAPPPSDEGEPAP